MTSAFSLADYCVLGAYFASIVWISAAIARKQRTGEEFFLAGRSMRGRTLALSIMANQASAVSLVGAPAFVALHQNGGLRWLQYEIALPIAMLLVIVVLLPMLRSVRGSSIYEVAERLFDRRTRTLLAGTFLLSRGLATGVILYAAALVVAPVMGISIAEAIIATGLFSVGYCVVGGIVADIWSDVVQLAVLWVGVLVSGVYLLLRGGSALVDAIPLDRAQTIVVDSTGLTDGNTFALVPMVLGGIVLYCAYYACDQTQAQRLLAASSDAEARSALALNGLLRFPLVLTYCLFGLLLAGLHASDGSFAAAMKDQPADALVPTFILTYLPAGLRGLLVAAILAAAMSSLDSALNSLAAVTLEDIAGIDATRSSVWAGRATTLAWGISAMLSALVFARGATGVLELITRLGSLFYGPALAVFVGAAVIRDGRGKVASAALVIGLAVNLVLSRYATGMSSLWWNVFGFLVAFGVLVVGSRPVRWTSPATPESRWSTRLLGAGSAVMFVVIVALPTIIAWVVTP